MSGDVYAVGKPGRLTIETCPKRRDILEPVRVQLGENRLDSGWVLAAQLISPEELEKNENVHKKSANELLDYDKIKGEMFLRPRQPGDRMQLPGRGFTSAVKKLIQANLPPERRSTAYILADGEGVVCVRGVGCAARVCPDEKTRRLLVLEWFETT